MKISLSKSLKEGMYVRINDGRVLQVAAVRPRDQVSPEDFTLIFTELFDPGGGYGGGTHWLYHDNGRFAGNYASDNSFSAHIVQIFEEKPKYLKDGKTFSLNQ